MKDPVHSGAIKCSRLSFIQLSSRNIKASNRDKIYLCIGATDHKQILIQSKYEPLALRCLKFINIIGGKGDQ